MKDSKVFDRHSKGNHSKSCMVYSPIWLGYVCKYMKWGKPFIFPTDKMLYYIYKNKNK